MALHGMFALTRQLGPLLSRDEKREKKVPCTHCGIETTASDGEDLVFCCRGCRIVHRLLSEEGLTRFYRFRRGRGVPVSHLNAADEKQSLHLPYFASLDGEKKERYEHLRIRGMHCSACCWLLETLFRRQRGSRNIEINPGSGDLALLVEADFSFLKFAEELSRFGYELLPGSFQEGRVSNSSWTSSAESTASTESKHSSDQSERDLLFRMGIAIALALHSMTFSISLYLGLSEGLLFVLFHRLNFVIALLSVLIGGAPFLRRAIQGLRTRVITLDLPIALGMWCAFLGSSIAYLQGNRNLLYFDSVSVFVALMLVGRVLRERVVAHHRSQLREDDGYGQLYVRTLDKSKSSREIVEVKAVHDIRVGDKLLINAGDLLPVAAKLLSDSTTFSQDWINGESRARTFSQGEQVPAGSFLQSSTPALLTASQVFAHSPVRRLAQASRHGAQQSSQQAYWWSLVSKSYVFGVLAIAILCFLFWSLAEGSVQQGLSVATSILVVTCPCAVGIAIPLAYELLHLGLSKSGLIVRRSDVLDKVGQIQRVVFDKTGTLTTGSGTSEEVIRSGSSRERSILYTLASQSSHPKSAQLLRTLSKEDKEPLSFLPIQVEENIGEGIEAEVDGSVYRLGRPDYVRARSEHEENDGKCADVAFGRNGSLLSRFRIEEALKPSAADDIKVLGALGLQTWILSGDTQERVDPVAVEVGVSRAHAYGSLSPEDKSLFVEKLGPRETLFVGDGANDCLAASHASLVGTPAVDKPLLAARSDFYLTTEGLAPLRVLFQAAKRMRLVASANVAFAVAYNLGAVSIAALGLMRPWLAAFLMPLSSILALSLTACFVGYQRSFWRS